MNKLNEGIHNFMDKIASVIKYSFKMINEDRILLIFFLTMFVMDMMVKISSGMQITNVRSFLFNFSWYALIIAFSFKFKTHKSRTIYFVTLTVFNFILTLGNIVYYRYYESFLSLSIVKQISLFAAMPDSEDIGIELVTIFDVLLTVTFVLSIIVMIKYTKDNRETYEKQSTYSRKYIRGNFLRLSVISFMMGVSFLQGAQYSQVTKLWNRPIVVENFGLATYHLVDSVKSASLFIDWEVKEEDYQFFLEYYNKRNNQSYVNEYTNRFKGKNVIAIHAESIEHFVINAEWEGQEITPHLNRLINSGYYFKNTYPQQSVGTSSDTEFTISTSLLPVNNGTIFLDHFDKDYMTMQYLLKEKGYQTLSFHGNNGTFWNRSIMHPRLGFDKFYDKNAFLPYTDEETIGLGIGDEIFFRKSVEILEEYHASEDPFYANLIMLTNHTPWGDVEKYTTYDENGDAIEFSCGALEGKQICRYLKAVRYADYSIGVLINELEEKGMLDDTIIFVYGDHPANIKQKEMELFYGHELTTVEYKAQQKVPFFIWSKDIEDPQIFEKAIGLLDAGPILQNMLGIHNPFNLGFDYNYDQTLNYMDASLIETDDQFVESAINPYEQHIVPFVNGDWTDGIVYYDAFLNRYILLDDRVPESAITDDYIDVQNERVEEILTISNLINRYNLIKVYHEREEIEGSIDIQELGEIHV